MIQQVKQWLSLPTSTRGGTLDLTKVTKGVTADWNPAEPRQGADQRLSLSQGHCKGQAGCEIHSSYTEHGRKAQSWVFNIY